MDYVLTVTMFLMGGLFSYLTVLSVQLYRSVSRVHTYRLAAAISMSAWSIELLLFFVDYGFAMSENTFYYHMSYIYSFMLVPTMAHVLYTLLRRERAKQWPLLIYELPYMVLIGLYGVVSHDLVGKIAMVYSLAFAAVYFTWFVVALRNYSKKLQNAYSSAEGLRLGSFRSLGILLTFWILLYVFDYAFRSQVMSMCYYGASFILWGFLNQIILRQREIDISMLEKTDEKSSIWADLGSMPTSDFEEDVKTKEVHQLSVIEIKETLARCVEQEMLYLDPDLNIRMVADKVGTSIGTLISYLNTCRGLTFSSYVNLLRLRYAAQRLSREPNINIARLATISGFYSKFIFKRLFKRHFGVTVRQFAKDNSK